jgi:hypothetical protein
LRFISRRATYDSTPCSSRLARLELEWFTLPSDFESKTVLRSALLRRRLFRKKKECQGQITMEILPWYF